MAETLVYRTDNIEDVEENEVILSIPIINPRLVEEWFKGDKSCEFLRECGRFGIEEKKFTPNGVQFSSASSIENKRTI